MDENKNNGTPLPDISGVFSIDENKISGGIIEKENNDPGKRYSPVLLKEEDAKEFSPDYEKRLQKRLKRKHKEERKKKIKRYFIAAVACIVLLAAVIGGIAFYVEYKARPFATTGETSQGDIIITYEAEAMLINSTSLTGKVSQQAVFCENEYDIHSLKEGQSCVIRLGTSEYFGAVSGIGSMRADEDLFMQLAELIPDDTYSAAQNYIVTVDIDDTVLIEDESTVSVEITTGAAEDAVTVPTCAVFRDENGSYVWTFRSLSKKIYKNYIVTGIGDDKQTEVLSGVKAKATVITAIDREQELLTDGMKVKVKTEKNGN